MSEGNIGASGEIIKKISKPRVNTLLEVAHGPTYPFQILQLKEADDGQTTSLTLELSHEIYEYLKVRYGTDELIVYFDLVTSNIQSWTLDMLFSMNILRELGLMSPTNEWISNSREYMGKLLGGKREITSPEITNKKKALEKAREILSFVGILEEVEKEKALFSIAKDVIKSNSKDPDSIIYRLAMTIFHSARLTEKPAIPSIEEPGDLYLALTQSEKLVEKYPLILENLEKLPIPARAPNMKTLMSFLIASYIYFKTL